jgi:pyridoxine kinase
MHKVISIQSHVAEGYAGNKAAVFPLQRLGVDVTVINTVQFSNHTGHLYHKGEIFASNHIEQLFDGLMLNNKLHTHDAILTGYLGDKEIGFTIIKQLKAIRRRNANFIYCCDTVFGDTESGTYAKTDIPSFFRDELLQYANIMTPNHYELEILTNTKITDVSSALKACDIARGFGPEVVLLTSAMLSDPASIGMLASTSSESWLAHTPKIPLNSTVGGTGDVTSAIFLAHYLNQYSIEKALSKTISSIYGIISNTSNLNKNELALIEAQAEITSPSSLFTAKKVR